MQFEKSAIGRYAVPSDHHVWGWSRVRRLGTGGEVKTWLEQIRGQSSGVAGLLCPPIGSTDDTITIPQKYEHYTSGKLHKDIAAADVKPSKFIQKMKCDSPVTHTHIKKQAFKRSFP